MTEGKGCSRRDFLKLATAAGLSASLVKSSNARENEETRSDMMTTQGHLGEPYDLAGKRLVFTNWHYVRPGDFRWSDAEGNKLGLSTSVGQWDAHFRRFDYPYGIRLAVQPAQKRRLEGVSSRIVIQDGSVYRAWGGAYYESKDGMNWESHELIGDSSGTVFIDPSAPDEERYKGVHLADAKPEEFEAYRKRRPNDIQSLAIDADPGRVHAVFGTVSPDGIHWKKIPVPIVVEHSDTQIVAYYDERLRKYVMYTRNYPVAPRSDKVPYDGFKDIWEACRRSIGRTESDDFRNFPISEVIVEPWPELLPSDMLYTNCRTAIPSAPDQHLMFPTIWHTSDDSTSIAIMSSHDTKLWSHLPGGPVFETGAFGEWDGGCIFAPPNLVELPNGDFALPYTSYTFPHKYPGGQLNSACGYAIWQKGRLVAIEAPEIGYFATAKIVPPGRKLKINAVVHRAGSILVEATDSDRNPIPGRTFEDSVPIIGDQHWTPVTWKGKDDLGHKEGNPIMLRFRMDKAKIFGLEFG